MSYKRRCNNCIHVLCDVVGRQRPERNVQFVCESIVLFEKCFGLEYKEETRELALDAVQKYGPGTPFENDERMLPIYRILGKYSRSMTSTDLYDKLNEKGLFATSAPFFFDWIEVHLHSGQIDRAQIILGMMEQAVGAQHVSCLLLRSRIEEETVRERERPRGMSKIAALVKPVGAQNARRNLFGTASAPEATSVTGTSRPSSVNEDHPMNTSSESIKTVFPPSRDEPIVLPNIVEAPPVDLSIVSPSINLIQSGQYPSNFTLPPVFSFANTSHSSAHTYKSSMHATTRETTMIRNSIMSTSMIPTMPPPFNTASALNCLPSHPAQIGQFAVPALPPFRNDIGSNSENMDPRGANSTQYTARRDITGVLMPSKNFPLDPFGELEKPNEPKSVSTYEMKKARLDNQLPTHSTAARRIFGDTTKVENAFPPLENAFQSFAIDTPSTSKQ